MSNHWRAGWSMILLLGCGHSDAFVVNAPSLGPVSTGSDVRLTFNPDQDYWPIWTEDGRGVTYAFVDPGANSAHRCIGLLPPAGGTRIWQLCDNRATQVDSTSSFPAFALGSDGRLLYAESMARNRMGAIVNTTLWLADSAHPFARTALLTLPLIIDGTSYTWLGDIRWTGPTTFVALAQLFETFAHCRGCGQQDTLLTDRGIVVIGTIVANHATFAAIGGATGVTGYSLAESGASVVFTRAHDTHLYKTPITGGTATIVANVVSTSGRELTGVSCKGSTCVVASDPLTLTDPLGPIYPTVNAGPLELYSVALSAGGVQLLKSSAAGIFASPQLSPLNGDVIVQVGGVWGHLQTNTGAVPSDLHLFAGLVP